MTATTLMWRLGRSLPERGGRPVRGLQASLIDRERRLGLRPGQPFLLRPDGAADVEVLAFFASASFGLLSEQSQLSYAKDLRYFLSFLESQDVPWRDADHDDLLNFEYWRRRDPDNPQRVSAAKFARELAACRKFYEWQQARGVVSSSPLLGAALGDGTQVMRPHRAARSVRVKWLAPRAFRQWRDVGLAGYLPDGQRDAAWRGRNEGRNTAFADLLWGSGLRLREGASLLVWEVPARREGANYLRGRVGAGVAKGRGRDFWVAADALSTVAAYVSTSRAASVRRAQRGGRYDARGDRLTVVQRDGDRLQIAEADSGEVRSVLAGDLEVRDRERLFLEGPHGLEPAMVFLGESGDPMRYATWEAVFAQASKRCRSLGLDLGCYPHMLRHSFALRMLLTLTHVFDRRMGLTPEQRQEYRHLFGDPWVLVQTLLGHASPQTTKDTYLEPIGGLHVDLFLNGDEVDEDLQFFEVVHRHLAATGLVHMGDVDE